MFNSLAYVTPTCLACGRLLSLPSLLCCHWLSHRPHCCSYRLSLLLNSLACVQPLWVACRSLLSLLSSAMRPSAVASASLSLSSAVTVARLARVRAAALRGVPLAAFAAVVSCRIGLAIALVGCCRRSHRSRACLSSAWRTDRFFRGCSLLAFALIGCRCC